MCWPQVTNDRKNFKRAWNEHFVAFQLLVRYIWQKLKEKQKQNKSKNKIKRQKIKKTEKILNQIDGKWMKC